MAPTHPPTHLYLYLWKYAVADPGGSGINVTQHAGMLSFASGDERLSRVSLSFVDRTVEWIRERSLVCV
jgi:hypothetical protein